MDTPLASPVLVTRPAREAAQWVQALEAQGVPARALPLIVIAPAPDGQALAACRDAVASYGAVMFVSVNAVDGFLGDGLAWPATTRAWAPGPGTLQALLRAGVSPGLIDAPPAHAAQFDSETLWQDVRRQVTHGTRVLMVRGGDAQGRAAGRPWLAEQLAAAGATVDTVVSYVRRRPDLDATLQGVAEAGRRGQGWWLFSSSEAIDNLRALLPGQDWSAARALCTHPRIAQVARTLGFGTVAQTRPMLEAVVGFLQSGS